ncbi:MAG: hypothetical protein KDA41_13835 [Planctomycetales bacterium]|nr:hypothetical protein [Planctomycetales bacterium]
MWCSRCQQDVPAVASPSDAQLVCCARCRSPLKQPKPEPVAEAPRASGPSRRVGPAPTAPTARLLDDWSLEDDLREAQRLVQFVQMECGPRGGAWEDDEPQPAPHYASPHSAVPRSAEESGGGNFFSWLLCGLGLAGLACGASLLVWSQAADRPELWNIGLPTALVSQAILTCGLLLHFSAPAPRRRIPQETTGPTHVHLHSDARMHPAGMSVHYSSFAAARPDGGDRLFQRQIEAAVRRAA